MTIASFLVGLIILLLVLCGAVWLALSDLGQRVSSIVGAWFRWWFR